MCRGGHGSDRDGNGGVPGLGLGLRRGFVAWHTRFVHGFEGAIVVFWQPKDLDEEAG